MSIGMFNSEEERIAFYERFADAVRGRPMARFWYLYSTGQMEELERWSSTLPDPKGIPSPILDLGIMTLEGERRSPEDPPK